MNYNVHPITSANVNETEQETEHDPRAPLANVGDELKYIYPKETAFMSTSKLVTCNKINFYRTILIPIYASPT